MVDWVSWSTIFYYFEEPVCSYFVKQLYFLALSLINYLNNTQLTK